GSPATAAPRRRGSERRVSACASSWSVFHLRVQPQPARQIVERGKRGRVIGKGLARLRKRVVRLVLLPEHSVGAQQPLPASQVRAVSLEPLRETLDHLLDHGGAIGRSKLLSGRNVLSS